MTNTLHFTFTPVQAFVSQARRTRDLWAGSYLLAWLSGQAINAVINSANGKAEILVPNIENNLLIEAIQNPQRFFKQKKDCEKELVGALGTLPNRFTATIPDTIDPAEYARAIQNSWTQLGKAVLLKIDPGKRINQDFWDRQINNHWDVSWVLGNGLDSRKNLRLPTQSHESGEKCTVCGERQELYDSSEERQNTGHASVGQHFKPNRQASRAWWATLKNEAILDASDLDLRQNERLCAVCLTKRLFPLIAEQTIGWKVEKNYPSTSYLSAIDWLETVLEQAASQNQTEHATKIRTAANQLVKTTQKLNLYHSEYHTKIKGLSEKIQASGINKQLIDLDGDVFYQSSIDSDQLETQQNKKLDKTQKRELSNALLKLQTAVNNTKATPFYALLLMDGDGMGKLLGCQLTNGSEISKALAKFTDQVPDIVYNHNGKLIYAGGDDVFALLPVSTAIRCAAQCREAYGQAFAGFTEEIRNAATISAAVQFAHQNIALNVVVKDAHRLLDDIAKHKTGRDALACRVWKPGGIVLTWSQPWTVAQSGQPTLDFVQLLETLVDSFRPDCQADRFSSKFLYKLRNLFELIAGWQGIKPEEVSDLLLAEYLANRELKETDPTKKRKLATEHIANLLALCQQQIRSIENGEPHYKADNYNADAALLIRFLVQKEV